MKIEGYGFVCVLYVKGLIEGQGIVDKEICEVHGWLKADG